MSKLVNYPFTWGGVHGDVSCNLSTLVRVGGGRLNECKSNERICGRAKRTDSRVRFCKRKFPKCSYFNIFKPTNICFNEFLHQRPHIYSKYGFYFNNAFLLFCDGQCKRLLQRAFFWKPSTFVSFKQCQPSICDRFLLTTRNEVIA